MVKKALSEKYRAEREKRAKMMFMLRWAYRIGWILWVVGALVFFIVIYLKYH